MIGYILHSNCIQRHIIAGTTEGRTDVKGRRGRRRTKLLDDLKEKKGCCKLKEETLDRTV